MDHNHNLERRVQSRDTALRLLHRLTVGAAFAAAVGVGLFSAVSAATIPGTAASAPSTETSAPSASTSASSTSSAAGVQPSGGVNSSSGGGMAVTGASH